MNYLRAIFWDYPQLLDEKALSDYLKGKKDLKLFLWILSRFLNYGRSVDALHYFKIDEIKTYLPQLRLTPYAFKKWNRLIEIYGKH